MDSSKVVLLNIPTCSVNYKLYLDDLDLALLPMSQLTDKYSLRSSRPKLDGPKNGPNDRRLKQSDEKLKDQSVPGFLDGMADCSVVEFEATAERQEGLCVNETLLNEAKDERQMRFCHICNIAVSKTYAKDHNKSKLHITLLRLANEAVARLNKHIQQQLSEAVDTCYCESCNEEVESLDEHEKQIKHQLLKKREELLANLVDLYTEGHGAFDERTRQINNVEQSPLDNSDTNDNRNYRADKNEALAVTNCTDAAVTKPEEPSRCPPEHDHIVKESFVGLKNGVGNDNDAPIVNDAGKASQGNAEAGDGGPPQEGAGLFPRVPTDTNAIYYFCEICAVNVPNNTTNIIGHLNCPVHRTKLEQIIEHDAEKSISKDDSAINTHCNICAVGVPNITSQIVEHYSSASHMAKLDQFHVAETKSVSKDTGATGHYYCNICAVKVPNSIANIIEHDNGAAHKAKMEEIRSGRVSRSTNEPQVTSSLAPHKPTNQLLAGSSIVPHLTQAAKDAITTGCYYCRICSVNVPNNTNNISGHNLGAAHRAKLEKLQAAGSTRDTQNVSSVALEKKTHESQPSGSITTNKPTQVKPPGTSADQHYCNICAITVPNNLQSLYSHVNGPAHKANTDPHKKIMKSETTQNVATKNGYAKKGLPKVNDYCTVCGVTTGTGNFEQHLLSKSHKECVRSGKATDETVGYNLCQLCNFEMPNQHTVINAHYTGISHTNNFKRYLAKNSIDNLGDSQIRCNVCLKSMHLTFVWGHVKNEQHVAYLKKSEKSLDRKDPDFCYVCKVKVGRNNMKVHVAGNNHKLNIEAQKL